MVPEYDEIGIWSEVKLAIIKEYAAAYARILDKTRREKIPSLRWLYSDAFAGPGVHFSKTTGEIVDGSPLIALKTIPPFSENGATLRQHRPAPNPGEALAEIANPIRLE